jgi:ketosteroid isomerase-like protein
LIAAWNQSDFETIESLFWPDAQAQAPEGWLEGEDSEGWPEIFRQFERLKDSWEEDEVEVESVEAVGEDGVLMTCRWKARGKESGIDVEFATWILSRYRDGKISRAEFYLDEAQALRAAGK